MRVTRRFHQLEGRFLREQERLGRDGDDECDLR